MAKYRCNSCETVYSDTNTDGSPYAHACHPDVIEAHAVCNADGQVTVPEKRTPRADLRDENIRPGAFYVDGKVMVEYPDPETPARMLRKPGKLEIVAEGAGRTLVEE
jgi:hypothetical protein